MGRKKIVIKRLAVSANVGHVACLPLIAFPGSCVLALDASLVWLTGGPESECNVSQTKGRVDEEGMGVERLVWSRGENNPVPERAVKFILPVAQVSVIVFNSAGKLFEFSSVESVEKAIDRYHAVRLMILP